MNKRFPDLGSTSQPFKRQAGGAPQIKPVVLQRQRVVAQIKPTGAQLKNPPSERVKSPVAPDVYRPQTVPRVLQTKSLKTQIMQAGPNCPPPAQTGAECGRKIGRGRERVCGERPSLRSLAASPATGAWSKSHMVFGGEGEASPAGEPYA